MFSCDLASKIPTQTPYNTFHSQWQLINSKFSCMVCCRRTVYFFLVGYVCCFVGVLISFFIIVSPAKNSILMVQPRRTTCRLACIAVLAAEHHRQWAVLLLLSVFIERCLLCVNCRTAAGQRRHDERIFVVQRRAVLIITCEYCFSGVCVSRWMSVSVQK